MVNGRDELVPDRDARSDEQAPSTLAVCTELVAVATFAPLAERLRSLADRAIAGTKHAAGELTHRHLPAQSIQDRFDASHGVEHSTRQRAAPGCNCAFLPRADEPNVPAPSLTKRHRKCALAPIRRVLSVNGQQFSATGE